MTLIKRVLPGRVILGKTLPALFLLPALTLSGFFFIIPLVQAFFNSITTPQSSSTLDNYRYFADSAGYQADMWFTLALGLGTVIGTTLLALPLALLFRHDFRGKSWLWGIALLPLVTPHIIAAYALRLTLSTSSPLFFWLPEGNKPELVNSWTGLLIAMIWKFYPVMLLPLLSALEGLPPTYEEAARDLGAGKWRRLRTILLPLIAPGWLAGVVLVFVLACSQFSLTLVIYGGQKLTTIPLDVYFETFSSRNPGLAAALGFVLMLLTLSLTVGVTGIIRHRTRRWIEVGMSFAGREARSRGVSRLAITFAIVGLSLFILVPLICLVLYSFSDQWLGHSLLPSSFTLRWYEYLFKYEGGLSSLGQSLIIALACVVITLTVSIPASYALARYHFWGHGILEGLFLAKSATPVIVLAIGTATLFYSWHLVDTFWGIVLAHSVGALPLAVRSITAAFERTDRNQEEAARDLGATAFHRFFTIILPLSLGGIMGGAVLTFLFSMDEFTVTFLISGVNFTTLPLRLYSSLNQGYIEPASAAAVILLLPSILYLVALLKLFGTSQRMGDIALG